MKQLLVVGTTFATQFPEVIDAASQRFDTIVIDFLALGAAITALRGREIYATILQVRTIEYFAPMIFALHDSGTRLIHCISRDNWTVPMTPAAQQTLGLCGHIDESCDPSALVDNIDQICGTCDGEAHAAWRPTSERLLHTNPLLAGEALSDLDREIVDLIAHGLTDQQIAEALSFSVQTIRNKVSHMLKLHGFENRTTLASAHLHTTFRESVWREINTNVTDNSWQPPS